MKIVLAGNPNCGKSTIFNALTGAHAKTGNWHGVTVGETVREGVFDGVRVQISDMTVIYSLNEYSLVEKCAR